MSDSNLGMESSIELSDIRKLDILLTQCETSSCENICNDCCARLGSLEDDDDETSSGERPARAAPPTTAAAARITLGDSGGEQSSGVINNVPVLSYVTEASTPSQPDRDASDDGSKLTPLGCDNKSASCDGQKRTPLLGNTRSYCTKCGGIKLDGAIKSDLGKKRYFSLDKERTQKTSANLLGTLSDTERGGSENLLTGCRKHCSFEDNCDKSGCEGKPTDSRMALKSPPSKKSGSHASSKSNPISSKSSQNSLKENRSRKGSLFHGISDRDSSFRSRFSTLPASRRFSSKGPLGTSDEQDAETREILLSRKADSDLHASIKIPEPVEAVCDQKPT